MDTASEKKINYNLNILPPETKKAFIFLSEQSWLSKSGWYLAGGTALALQTRNRKSVDLDFFTIISKFKSKSILDNF